VKFGVFARPELRASCAEISLPEPKALPALRTETVPATSDVHLGLVVSKDAQVHTIEQATSRIAFGSKLTRARTVSGDAQTWDVELRGAVCGNLGLSAPNLGWTQADELRFLDVSLAPDDRARASGSGIDAAPFVQAVHDATLPVPIAVSALPSILPELAAGMSDDNVAVSAAVTGVERGRVIRRGAEVVAEAVFHGSLSLRARR
jgi:hypothetical protein